MPAYALVDVVACGVRLATLRLDGAAAELAVVDALARLQLAAARRGWSLRLREAPADLRALLAFLGLAEVLGSGGEAWRQPERREQRRVEEVVQPHQPTA